MLDWLSIIQSSLELRFYAKTWNSDIGKTSDMFGLRACVGLGFGRFGPGPEPENNRGPIGQRCGGPGPAGIPDPNFSYNKAILAVDAQLGRLNPFNPPAKGRLCQLSQYHDSHDSDPVAILAGLNRAADTQGNGDATFPGGVHDPRPKRSRGSAHRGSVFFRSGGPTGPGWADPSLACCDEEELHNAPAGKTPT